ncbi:MAG: hypothetical protein ACYSU6_04580 [Planctomycetota bacterium]|jgi:hypothetical protein
MFMFGGAGKSSSEKESLGLGPKEVVVFCVLLATLHFVFRGYSYGIGNHIEQLPKLYRLLDVSFCSNDFSVNAGAAFGPRTYYLNFLGFLCSRVRPPVVFLVLAWLGSIGLAVVTYLAAKDLVEDSDLVGMIACVLVMGTTSTNLGGVGRAFIVGWHAGQRHIMCRIGVGCLSDSPFGGVGSWGDWFGDGRYDGFLLSGC